MKRVQFEKTGNPEEVLYIKEIPVPKPGKGEVRIKMTAANINPSDIMFVKGLYGIRPELPSPAGFEATGVIDACGENTTLKSGDRVIFTAVGVWQEFVVVTESRVFPAPPSIPDEIACQAFVNPYTAFAMINRSGIKKDQWLLLTAGASAFGKFAIQMCRNKGIHTICTVRHDSQITELQALGASFVVNTEKNDLLPFVMTHTEKRGVDFVFDAVGGELGSDSLACLAHGGTMYVYGLMSLKSIPLNSGIMIFKSLTIKGFWFTEWLTTLSRDEKLKATGEILALMEGGDLKAQVEGVYPLDDVAAAMEHVQSTGRSGKIILINT